MTTEGWNLEALRNFVDGGAGEKGRPLETIGSIDRAIQIFHYHLYEAKDANDRITPNTPSEAFDLVLTPTDRIEPLHREKITIQANAQSAAQNARSIHDIFAQLVNCLVLQDAIEIHLCDISRVTNKLVSCPLKEHLEGVLSSDEYQYINAMVNTQKHRNLVPFGAQISMENGEAGVQFQSFEYRGNVYPKLWAEDVLKHALWVKNSAVIAGIKLNEHVGA